MRNWGRSFGVCGYECFKICARRDKRFLTYGNASNAECAPETLPEAAGLVLRMFRLHEQSPRGVDFMVRLKQSAICRGSRGIGGFSGCFPRVPFHPYPSNTNHILPPRSIPPRISFSADGYQRARRCRFPKRTAIQFQSSKIWEAEVFWQRRAPALRGTMSRISPFSGR